MNKKKPLTLSQAIAMVSTGIELFEYDFGGNYDKEARLLHKHYTNILRLLKAVK